MLLLVAKGCKGLILKRAGRECCVNKEVLLLATKNRYRNLGFSVKQS